MIPAWRAIGLLAAGAGAMYLLDPREGQRRRADLREEARHLSVRSRARFEDTAGRWKDRLAEARTRVDRRIRPGRGAFDDVVEERVRSALDGITHAPLVEVRVRQGHVTLSGRVHATEVQPILDAVTAVPGVVAIEDALHLREPLTPPPRGRRLARSLSRQARWWPIVALLAGAAGAWRSSPEA